MTEFGDNVDKIDELDSANADSIVQNEGVFSISNNLEYTDVLLDPAFKALVDSVLK